MENENVPCEGCLVYPICKNKTHITCKLLWDYIVNDEMTRKKFLRRKFDIMKSLPLMKEFKREEGCLPTGL